jgi:hypothetical protein
MRKVTANRRFKFRIRLIFTVETVRILKVPVSCRYYKDIEEVML